MFTFGLISPLCWLLEIWQLSWQGATGELEVEFKFERCNCKLCSLFPPLCLSPLESLLAGYYKTLLWPVLVTNRSFTDLILKNVVFPSLRIQSDPINKDTEGARGSPKCHVSPPPWVRGSRRVAFQTRPEKLNLEKM